MTESSPRQPDSTPASDPYKALDDQVHARLADTSLGLSPISLALAQADWVWHLATSPGRQTQLAQKAFDLGLQAWSAGTHLGGSARVPETDTRFSDEAWQQWPFSLLKEGFKATEAWWREATQVEGMSGHHRDMVDFFARQGVGAMCPANWASTNPVAIKAGLSSGGQTWLKGGQHLLEDLVLQARSQPAQSAASGVTANEPPPLRFKVGKDVALQPGKVVYRNRLYELIQYTPTTAQVFVEPLLIVPSNIMKYYILDLSPGNSMVRYLVEQGFTVFMMSWRNPDASDRKLGMQDYLQRGVMDALAVVKQRAQVPRVHALGYCLGGTFLAIVAATLGRSRRQVDASELQQRRRGDDVRTDTLPELASVTLLAAQTDFSEPGELGVFIDDDQLKGLRALMAKTGYLSGRAMAGSFQFINSRDLVWSRNTRRYLLGLDDIGNDMMSWNADLTRLPERMHNEYLSSLFLNNALAAGHYRLAGDSVALMDLSMPLLVVGTARDHVSPWRSVYKIHLLTDTETTFVLAAGGHNAGIISEPGHAHRSYQMESAERGHAWKDPEEWLAQAPRFEGSWWPAMSSWLKQRSSGMHKPPLIARDHVLCKAPGSYVMQRYND